MITMTPLILVATLLLIAALISMLQRRWPLDNTPLVDAIDRVLPQTQCAQCGYPGCRPYAEAVANGAALDLCPPGGEATYRHLTELMGVAAEQPPTAAMPQVAVIDESRCIGCTLCLAPCPVDAIIGARGVMHTVLADECTGCELCIDPCPVDCIDLMPLAEAASDPTDLAAPPCINCGWCQPVCPVDLNPQTLYRLIDRNELGSLPGQGLDACVECQLCDRACPSDIPLAAHFGLHKRLQRAAAEQNHQRQRLQERYQGHQQRLLARQSAEQDKRSQRLQQRGRNWA